jgi:hypothetical protein
VRWRGLDIVGALALAGVGVLVVLAFTANPSAPSEPVGPAGDSILAATPPATAQPIRSPSPNPQPTVSPTQGPRTSPRPLPEAERGAIAIQVLNGGAPAGSAAAVSDLLRSASFAPGTPADAVEQVAVTTVLHAPNQRRAALAAADVVGARSADVRAGSGDDPNWAEYSGDLDVLVILGPALP